MGNRYIYIFTNSYLPVLGGVQTVTSQLANGLVSKGYKVMVITSLYPKNLPLTERIDRIRVWRLPFADQIGLRNKVLSVSAFMILFAIMLMKSPSLVYVHFPLNQCDCVSRLKKIFKYSIVTCFHGHDVLRYEGEGGQIGSTLYKAQKQLVLESIAVTACSKYLAKTVDRIFDIGCTQYVYNGVDISRFRTAVSKDIINGSYLFAFGRLEKVKGFNILIQAFADASLPDNIKLLIAGDGSIKNDLHALIERLGMTRRIELVGRKTPNEIAKLASNALVNVISSLREPFGIVAIEAIAAHRPLVATNRGGLPEIVKAEYGILCEPEVSDMSRAIKEAFVHSERFDFGDADRYLSEFTIEGMTDNYLKVAGYTDK